MEYNASGRINESLSSILDQLILSEENDNEEFTDCHSEVNSEITSNRSVSQQRQRDTLSNLTISYADNLFDGETSVSFQPIHFKMLEQLSTRRKSNTVPKPVLQRNISETFDVNESESIKRIRDEFTKKSNINMSNLESFRKQAILLDKYSNLAEEISDFSNDFEQFKIILSNFPESLRSSQIYNESCECRNRVDKQFLKFENRSYNQISDLDNAFDMLCVEIEKVNLYGKQLNEMFRRHQAEIEIQKQQHQQQQQQQQQQQMVLQQQMLLKQQMSLQTTPQPHTITTSTPIQPSKTIQDFPGNFFKLSNLKGLTTTTTTTPALSPKQLITQLEDMEQKCSAWDRKCSKEKILNFKRIANTTINAISSHDMDSLMGKINLLHSLLSGQTVSALDITFKAESQEEIDYCSNLITAKLIRKGEQEISSNPKAAHPIACVAVCLCSNHPSLAQLLLASLYRACPLIAPMFPPKDTPHNTEAYLLSVGYRRKEGKLEDLDEFSVRIKGILRLYACIMQFPIEGISSVFPISTHFHGVAKAWEWLVRVLQGPIVPGVSDVALHEAFEFMGYRMGRVYGNQFFKLVQLASNEFLPRLSSVSPAEHNPSVARLKKFLDEHKTQIPETDGAFSVGFWQKNVFK